MLEIKNIYKNFDKLEVLKGVSTVINDGQVVSIIGASGSGKSTLLRCMNLLEPVQSLRQCLVSIQSGRNFLITPSRVFLQVLSHSRNG